ncbi:hypothetical protein A2631_04515 [Candidatus Daviesbacteria bacterium RIFCSPHIGHO2_01_FULL_44_29]|uniref:Uncharacterized protein n=1 Tax=Candidatus Daviesbacteria bacterium RIFCSPHIGHO2_02_FULL_43_12 TaxID=1797776 RepID=A0A1F5KGC4_9BACT|nr:MAG: hypothetical protein A2631_04515 [Candidatus Daviesbacteria bacterium RIFCSPHIGHO2_01_FULL_44_29]OGE39605.1 MAG: hypothetical protein A3E86_05670 [Candidatus Daviesbacteria bacterium RIFCSPHIGHO2_12_FULL_47_45]OGE39986.1 MAG: hypothetical protein A3D25_04245 [Candidatus Daviesbacteria bacterium RIFCSPHIGHO2_02_FULL_43_12]OGE70333.1 MAG: hypothetical protein A3B55_01325 [Candidatus Daviesbacteria bacterium RIFCSPLOWO2_01_FULL_43_15]
MKDLTLAVSVVSNMSHGDFAQATTTFEALEGAGMSPYLAHKCLVQRNLNPVYAKDYYQTLLPNATPALKTLFEFEKISESCYGSEALGYIEKIGQTQVRFSVITKEDQSSFLTDQKVKTVR